MKNYFILPGLYSLQKLNLGIRTLFKTNSNFFYPNIYIQQVFGSLPNAIWNGDKLAFSRYQPLSHDIVDILQEYVRNGLQVIFNFNNSAITENDCDNVYCNILMQLGLSINLNTQCSVNSRILYEYLLNTYPQLNNIYLGVNNSIPAENTEPLHYFLNPIHNGDTEYLKSLKFKPNIVITLNPLCLGCGNREECILKENLAQLNYDPHTAKINTCNVLKYKDYNLSKDKFNSSIIPEYNSLGFSHFCLEEYPTLEENLEEYLFFLIKPEYYYQAKEFLLHFMEEHKK